MSIALLARRSLSAAGSDAAEVLRFLRKPSPPVRVSLPEAGIDVPLRLMGSPDWEDVQRLTRHAEQLVQGLIEDAGLSGRQLAETALIVASSSLDVGGFEAAQRRGDAARLIDRRNALAGHLATRFQTGGPHFTLNAACASGAAALVYARRMIEAQRVRHVLVIGSEGLNQLTPAGFAALKLLAPNQCRPFAPDRPGMVLGEAVAGVVLGERESPIGWTLAGSAMNCDPYSPTASTAEAMRETMLAAIASAGSDKKNLQAVKVHGTGSIESDQAEAHAFSKAFPELPPLTGFKPMLGHTLGASAVLELVVLTQMVDAGWLPAAADDVDPALPLHDVRQPALPGAGDYLLNTFGFGGNNAAIVMRKEAG